MIIQLLMPLLVFAHQPTLKQKSESASQKIGVFTNLEALDALGIPALAKDSRSGVGYAEVGEKDQNRLFQWNHEKGRCGGYEALPETLTSLSEAQESLKALGSLVERDQSLANRKIDIPAPKRPEIDFALRDLKEDNVQTTVQWLSSFPDRDHRKSDPNKHIAPFETKIKEAMAGYSHPWKVDLISHKSTTQKSVRLRIEGSERPSEIIVLGGHLDSINGGWGGGGAPGADDNASGSAALLEALRVLAKQDRPERSIEFFWYAGEESGLLGSAEIAKQYKAESKDVVAVLQVDMTLFPGAGEFVVGNISDFTSPWLRSYLESRNNTYIKAKLIDDKCGYACSDHASWYRQGYATLMPFEADTSRMNKKIHTANDKVDETSSFRHALVFSKIALVFAMDLGNSTIRP